MTVILEDIGFSYNDVDGWLFEQVNVRFSPRRVYALVGFSGTGKTTLLKILGGILVPSRGRMRMTDPHKFGYAPQESSLLPWLSVQQNLNLGGELLPCEDAGWVELRARLADSFVLSRFLSRRPRALSGGMKQRAAVLSALTSGADVLLLDEPFAGSDRVCKVAMFEAIGEFMKRVPSGTVIFTTHDPGDVFALGAVAVWLDSGTPNLTVISPDGGWDASARTQLLELMIAA